MPPTFRPEAIYYATRAQALYHEYKRTNPEWSSSMVAEAVESDLKDEIEANTRTQAGGHGSFGDAQ